MHTNEFIPHQPHMAPLLYHGENWEKGNTDIPVFGETGDVTLTLHDT